MSGPCCGLYGGESSRGAEQCGGSTCGGIDNLYPLRKERRGRCRGRGVNRPAARGSIFPLLVNNLPLKQILLCCRSRVHHGAFSLGQPGSKRTADGVLISRRITQGRCMARRRTTSLTIYLTP